MDELKELDYETGIKIFEEIVTQGYVEILEELKDK